MIICNFIFRFPCLVTCRLLLECGADPNAQDLRKDTPLHYLIRCSSYSCNSGDESIEMYSSMLTDLIKYGAHVDTVNSEGQTPIDLTTSGLFLLNVRK